MLIPVCHELPLKDIVACSPLLADRLVLNTADGLPAVARCVVDLLRQETKSYRPGRPLWAGTLTKKVLKEVPEGCYLLSNALCPDATPTVSQYIPPLGEREALWQSLKEQRISGTRFYVFATDADYRAHMSARAVFD